MPTEQPVSTPSEPVDSDAAATEDRSAETSEPSSPGLWQRLFGKREQTAPETEPESQTDDTQSAAPSPKTLNLTEDELDRRVQAETDRREAKRKREDLERQERERREAVERKLDPKSPDYDPYGGTEERDRLKAEEEANQQVASMFQNVQALHDQHTLDVVVSALPEPERQRILQMEGAGVGLEGRKLVMSESLRSLEKHWKSVGAREAEKKLRENPTFRKQLFHDFRDDAEEPELIAGAPSASGKDFMSLIQSDYQALRRGG